MQDIEQLAITKASKLIPFAERFDCVEFGIAIDRRGTIEAFEEIVTPADSIHIGDRVAVILTKLPKNDQRIWYAVPI